MGVWAVPAFRMMFYLLAVTSVCFLASVAAYRMAPSRWGSKSAILVSFTAGMVMCVGYVGTKYYFEHVDTKTVFMAQCQERGDVTGCLASYKKFYPNAR